MTRRIYLCYSTEPEEPAFALSQDEREDAFVMKENGYMVYEYSRIGLLKRGKDEGV